MSLFRFWVYLSVLLVSGTAAIDSLRINIPKNDSNMTSSIENMKYYPTKFNISTHISGKKYFNAESKTVNKNIEPDDMVHLNVSLSKSMYKSNIEQNIQIFNNVSASENTANNTLENIQVLLNHAKRTDSSSSVNSTREIEKSENAKRMTHHHILARTLKYGEKYEKHKLLKAQPKYSNTKILENSTEKSFSASVTTPTISQDIMLSHLNNYSQYSMKLKYTTETQVDIDAYENFNANSKYKIKKRSNNFSYNNSGNVIMSDTGELIETSSGVNHPLWPVKRAAVVEGDLVLGGLMMVHSREDSVTCGPVMPQGGVQVFHFTSLLKIALKYIKSV